MTQEEQIFNFEDNLSEAAQQLLTTAGLEEVHLAGDVEELPNTHIEVMAQVGASTATGMHDGKPNEYTRYDAGIVVKLCTDLKRVTKDEHNTLRSQIRIAFKNTNRLDWTESTKGKLLYYHVSKIRPDGTDETVEKNERKIDVRITVLSFALEFTINADSTD